MSEEIPCRPRLLAAGSTCRVSRCDCGTVHVALGQLTLRLSEGQLARVAETLEAASVALHREGSAERTGRRLLC